jgi:hypothetical protein
MIDDSDQIRPNSTKSSQPTPALYDTCQPLHGVQGALGDVTPVTDGSLFTRLMHPRHSPAAIRVDG